VDISELYFGHRFSVYVLTDHRGRSQVMDIVEEAHEAERKQFIARVRRLADHGPEDTAHYSVADSREGLWYFRASKHMRIWFLMDGRRIVLLNALRKTRRATDPQGLERARELRRRYDEEMGL